MALAVSPTGATTTDERSAEPPLRTCRWSPCAAVAVAGFTRSVRVSGRPPTRTAHRSLTRSSGDRVRIPLADVDRVADRRHRGTASRRISGAQPFAEVLVRNPRSDTGGGAWQPTQLRREQMPEVENAGEAILAKRPAAGGAMW